MQQDARVQRIVLNCQVLITVLYCVLHGGISGYVIET
jgi:hypothetical protein